MKTKTLKTVLSALLLLLSMISIQAQVATEEVDLLQSLYGMEKKALISEFLGSSVNDSFWQVYDTYEMERKALGKERIDLLSNYVDNYSGLQGDKADELINKAERLNKKQNSLISKYTKKVRKVAGSEVAAQFYQVEHYLLSAMRAEIFENIPFIGTLKKE